MNYIVTQVPSFLIWRPLINENEYTYETQTIIDLLTKQDELHRYLSNEFLGTLMT